MRASREELLSVLRYEPETGRFFWKVCVGTTGQAGSEAGTINPEGYVTILYKRRGYRAHRIAWLFTYGEWPPEVIDHVDGNPTNNRISNLRACEEWQNAGNKGPNKNNTTGIRGVTFHKGDRKFHARFRGKYSGSFDTIEEAGARYEELSRAYYNEFSFFNRPARVA